MNKQIAIIGAGISGLSTAYTLVNAGYTVQIFANAFSPNLVSNKAAAFWFPYHVRNDKRGVDWCQKSYVHFKQLANNPATGISMQKLIKALRDGVEETEITWLDFMPADSYRLINTAELPAGYSKGYEAIVPLIETQIFLPYLQNQLKEKGVGFTEQHINNLYDFAKDFDIVINCTALGARILCNDEKVIPVRGQVALLQPIPQQTIFLDNELPTYIVPRKDAIIIGGTYEEGVEHAITEPTTIDRLLQNAYSIFPALQQQNVMGNWAGLRPYRADIRLEKEENIIHNYGHGGSGYTLSFGCAEEVLQIVQNEF